MEYYNGLQCVTGFDFVQSLDNPDGVVKKGYYDKLCAEKKLKVVRRGCYNTPSLIEYSSIPQRFKEELRARGISPENRQSILSKMMDIDLDARDFYAAYMLADGRFLPEEK